MNRLFSQSEYQLIQQAASWPDENPAEAACSWLAQLQSLAAWLEGTEPEAAIGTELLSYHEPFFDFIQDRLQSCFQSPTDAFAPVLLKEIRENFLRETDRNWQALYRLIPESDLPEKTYAAAYSGALFRECALRYPLYARQITVYTFCTLEHLTLLFSRLSRDAEALYRCLNPGTDTPIPAITAVSGPLSDRHNHGQTAHRIVFADGMAAVYKPHSADTDMVWKSWLDYLCELAHLPPFVVPRLQNYQGYAYHAFVSPHAFRSEEEIRHFVFREGFLLGAAYLLLAKDLHNENIIADADPVVVDTEAILDVRRTSGPNPYAGISVISTALLPFVLPSPGYQLGLSGSCGGFPSSPNRPRLDDRSFIAADFPEEMRRGFSTAMQSFLANKARCIAFVCKLASGIQLRQIIQNTQSYAYAISSFRVPSRLVCAKDASVFLEQLVLKKPMGSFPLLSREKAARLERGALRRMDIPYLTERVTPERIAEIQAFLEHVDEADFALQLKYLDFHLFPQDRWKKTSGECLPSAVLARKLAGGLNGYFGIVAERTTRRLFVSNPNPFYLEGNLGAAAALAAYRALCAGEDPELDRQIDAELHIYLEFTRSTGWHAACSVLEPGLAEGMGGFLVGCYFLFLLDRLTLPAFSLIADKWIASVEKAAKANRIISLSNSPLYNWEGTLFTLTKIARDTSLPAALRDSFLCCSQLNGTAPHGDAVCHEWEHAASAYRSFAVSEDMGFPFHGFTYGMGSALMHSLEAKCPYQPNHPVRKILDFFKRG